MLDSGQKGLSRLSEGIARLFRVATRAINFDSSVIDSSFSAQSIPVEIPSPPRRPPDPDNNDDSGFAASGTAAFPSALVIGRNKAT